MLLIKHYKFIARLFIAFFFISAYGCKKYQDGPLLSLHTKTHRVCGEWNVEYFAVNGYDSTAYVNNDPCAGYYIFRKDKQDYVLSYRSFGINGTDTSTYYYASGDWSFSNFKNDLVIDNDHVNPPWRHLRLSIFNEGQKMVWDIRRLTEKEMWLKGIYTDGREYFVKFKLKSE